LKIKRLLQRINRSGSYWMMAGLGVLLTASFSYFHFTEMYGVRMLTDFEHKMYDWYLRQTMPNTTDERIIVIDIDDGSIEAIGRWPWNRKIMADLVKQSFDKYQLSVLAFDIALPEPDKSSGIENFDSLGKTVFKDNAQYQEQLKQLRVDLDYDRIFAQTIKEYPVVLGFALVNSSAKSGALPTPDMSLEDWAEDKVPIVPTQTGYAGNLPMHYQSWSSTTAICIQHLHLTR
jgi:adenylate cyclase